MKRLAARAALIGCVLVVGTITWYAMQAAMFHVCDDPPCQDQFIWVPWR